MKIYQVVFLLDLDSISQYSSDEDIFATKEKTVREALLKILTFFATQHSSTDNDAAFCLKWSCKFYNSSVNRSIRQPCMFKDFNLVNFEKFENELESRLEQCRLDSQTGHHQQSTRSVTRSCIISEQYSGACTSQNDVPSSKQASQSNANQTTSFKTRIHHLELALKDLVCDYTWDQPYVYSPVRKTRRQQQNGEPRRRSNESGEVGEVENIVIVIAHVPRLHSELVGLVEGKRKLTQSVLLDKILPPNLYRQFVQISKIRLFWLDTADDVQSDFDKEIGSSDTLAIFDILHQALRKTGGGVIPLNAILPAQHICNESSANSNKHIPEALAFQMPVASLISGYLSDGRGIADKPTHARNCSQLHLNTGAEEGGPMMCNLELLPLFRSNISSENSAQPSENGESFKISCTNKAENETRESRRKVVSPATHFTVTCAALKKETNTYYKPRDIRVIGTMLFQEIHCQLIAKPLVYICCSMDQMTGNNQPKMDSLCLQRILMELATKQIALLVSCDDFCQGIFFPSSSQCQSALLYILASEGEASVFNVKVEPSSIPKDINVFIRNSLETFTRSSPTKRISSTTSTQQQDTAFSLTYLEKWFIPHPCHENTLRAMKAPSLPSAVHTAQKAIFKKLQKAYLPSLVKGKLQEMSSESRDAVPSCGQLRCSPRLKRDSRSTATVPASKLVPRSSFIQNVCKNQKNDDSVNCETDNNQSQAGLSLKKNVDEQASEIDMLTKLKENFANAISGDSALLSVSREILNVCRCFYTNENRSNAKICTRDAVSKHFLLKPGDVEGSNGSMEMTKKQRIRAHSFQSIIKLELLMIEPNKTEEYVAEITSHLRKLSFIAGPTTMSSFLHETLVQNYFSDLKKALTEICEDLNQPLPPGAAQSSPSSSDEEQLSPEKSTSVPTSMLSQMSAISSMSSDSNQSKSHKSKRSEVVIRFPSFGDVAHKRMITISQGNSKQRRQQLNSNTGPLTRSAQKRLKEKLAGSQCATRKACRRTLFNHGIPTTKKHTTPPKLQRPTTPNGRHVLRTKNVADTPVYKQVAQPTLRRQALKRKLTAENDSDDTEIVEESPDKQPDPSYKPRRSPKRHASSLRRGASFYANCPEPKAAKMAVVDNVAASKTPLRRSARKLIQVALSAISPDKKSKVKRVLILSDSPEKTMSKTPNKAIGVTSSPFGLRRSDRLSGTEASSNLTTTPMRRVKASSSSSSKISRNQEMKCTLTNSRRKSPRLSKPHVLDFNETGENEMDQSLRRPSSIRKAQETPKKPSVSRRLLQTPLKPDSKPSSQTPATNSSTGCMNDRRVPSTPIRNGEESPDVSPTHVFLYGPLARNLDDCLSRSASPVIPLLNDEMAEFYEDQNLCGSFETPFDSNDSTKCDNFHACPYSQYYSSNDTQMSSGGILREAVIPSEENSFLCTPNKTYPADIGSPECALPPWETQNGFNGAFALIIDRTYDKTQSKAGSLDTTQFSSADTVDAFEEPCSFVFGNTFSPSPIAASENNMTKRKQSTGFSDGYSLQRFTRQTSKELGITLVEFKNLTSEIDQSENGKESGKSHERKWKSASELSNASYASPSPSKFSRSLIKSKVTPPTDNSLFHLTNSPILSSVSSRITRHSIKRHLQIEQKVQRR